jgi:hypothetical protein
MRSVYHVLPYQAKKWLHRDLNCIQQSSDREEAKEEEEMEIVRGRGV